MPESRALAIGKWVAIAVLITVAGTLLGVFLWQLNENGNLQDTIDRLQEELNDANNGNSGGGGTTPGGGSTDPDVPSGPTIPQDPTQDVGPPGAPVGVTAELQDDGRVLLYFSLNFRNGNLPPLTFTAVDADGTRFTTSDTRNTVIQLGADSVPSTSEPQRWRVLVTNSEGESPLSEPSTPAVVKVAAPALPTDVRTTATDQGFYLSFTPGDDRGAGSSGLRVTLTPSNNPVNPIILDVSGTSPLLVTDPLLQNGVEYTAALQTLDGAGQASTSSLDLGAITPTTVATAPPAPPAILGVTPVPGALAFDVEVGTVPYGSLYALSLATETGAEFNAFATPPSGAGITFLSDGFTPAVASVTLRVTTTSSVPVRVNAFAFSPTTFSSVASATALVDLPEPPAALQEVVSARVVSRVPRAVVEVVVALADGQTLVGRATPSVGDAVEATAPASAANATLDFGELDTAVAWTLELFTQNADATEQGTVFTALTLPIETSARLFPDPPAQLLAFASDGAVEVRVVPPPTLPGSATRAAPLRDLEVELNDTFFRTSEGAVVVDGLTNGAPVQVRANLVDEQQRRSGLRQPVVVTPAAGATLPAAPTDVRLLPQVGTSAGAVFRVVWTAPVSASDVTLYEVRLLPDDLAFVVRGDQSVAVVGDAGGLEPGQLYTAQVRARTAAGFGPYSLETDRQAGFAPPRRPAPIPDADIYRLDTLATGVKVSVNFPAVPFGPATGGLAVQSFDVQAVPCDGLGPVLSQNQTASLRTVHFELEFRREYRFRYRVNTGTFSSPYSPPSKCFVADGVPAIPQTPVVVAGVNELAVLVQAALTNEAVVRNFIVTRLSDDAEFVVTPPAAVDAQTVLRVPVAGGSSSAFRVRAENEAGTSAVSPASASVAALTAGTALPAAPTAPLQTANADGSITLAVTAPATTGDAALIAYRVRDVAQGVARDFPVAESAAMVVPAELLSVGTTYNFTTVAVSGLGEGPSVAHGAAVSVGLPTRMAAPRTLTNAFANQVVVGFDLLSGTTAIGGSTILNYEVELSNGDGNTVAAGTLDPLNPTIAVSGVTAGLNVQARVRALNAQGAGPWSNFGNDVVRVAQLSTAPLNVAVQEGAINGGTVGQCALVWNVPGNDGGAPVQQFEVVVTPGVSNPLGSDTLTIAADRRHLLISRLTVAQAYTFEVAARTRMGLGASVVVNATPNTAVTLSDAPGLTSVTPGDEQLDLVLTTPASLGGAAAILAYEVRGVPDGYLLDPTASLTPTLAGLLNLKTYQVRVRALTAAGFSPAVSSTDVTPVAANTVPDPPTDVVAEVPAAGSLRVRFNPPVRDGGPAITGYTATASPGGLTATSVGTETDLTIAGLDASGVTQYSITVVATNLVGDSAPSSATPPLAPTAAAVTLNYDTPFLMQFAPAQFVGRTVGGDTLTVVSNAGAAQQFKFQSREGKTAAEAVEVGDRLHPLTLADEPVYVAPTGQVTLNPLVGSNNLPPVSMLLGINGALAQLNGLSRPLWIDMD